MKTKDLRNPARARRGAERGVAFILVVGVLAGLLVLAAPFLAIALNDREVARKTAAEAEAGVYADGLLRYGRWALERTHAAREAATGGDASTDVFSTPKWDVEEEFAVPLQLVGKDGKPLLASDGTPIFKPDDPKGRLVDLLVSDSQSIPNLWSSSPFLIASVLGRGTVSGDVEADAVELSLDTGEGFPEKNGALLIEGERITYSERVGGKFTGLGRAALPSGKARKIKAETWAIDDRAREIAMLPWKSPRAAGRFREAISATAVKEIGLGSGASLSAVEVDRIARAFNTDALRYTPDGFGLPRALVGNIDPATADLTDGFKIRVKNNDGISSGSVIRITDGVNTDYGFVLQSVRRGAFAQLTLIEPTSAAYEEGRTFVAPLIRHPVNLNTASKDVLTNVMLGLQLSFGNYGRGSQQRVSTVGVTFFVDAILGARPLKGWEDLRNVLQTAVETYPLVTDAAQLAAIFRNAVDPGDFILGNSTVPFCFASSDRYRLEASASINDASGRELARRRVRELVRVSAPIRQTFRLDTQEEFEESILRARWSPYFTTYPNPIERVEANGQVPASRIVRMLQFSANEGGAKQSGVFAHKTEGDVRLWPARSEAFGGYIEHFDGQAFGQPDNIDVTKIDPDGWIVENGPFEVPLRNGGQGGGPGGGGARGRRGQQGGGSILGRQGANPIKVDFWAKTGPVGGRRVLYDLAGEDPDQWRIQLTIEADGTLRAKVRDRTLKNPLSTFEEAAETVFTPEAGVLKPDTWYHFGISYRGSKPEDVAVWIDGFMRGRPKFTSTVQRTVKKGDLAIDAEDLTDWPDEGAAWVGREIVEFVRAGNSLQVIQYPNGTTGRGRRGTADIDHGVGEPVQLLGYSTAVASQGNQGGVAIPAGGSTLQSSLGPFNMASFQGNATGNVNLGPLVPPLPFDIHDPTKPNGDQLVLEQAPGCPFDVSCFQQSGGYLAIVSSFIGAPAPVLSALAAQGFAPGVEIAYYAGRSGNTLFGLQDANLPQWQGVTTLNGNIPVTSTRGKHAVKLLGGTFGGRPLVTVFPISVGLNDVNPYFDPQPLRGGGSTSPAPEFVSLGVPDYKSISNHRIEWIRYYHRDAGRRQLVCDDPDRLAVAAALADVMLTNSGGPNAVAGPWIQVNQALGFRGQLGTGIFGYDNPLQPLIHGVSEDVVPVFRVVEHPGIGLLPLVNPTPGQQPQPVPPAPAPGWGDSVTLEQANGAQRKRFDVSWSSDADVGNHGWVSFGESTRQDFTQGRVPVQDERRERYTRLLKFPSGELPPMGRGTRCRVGGDVDGNGSVLKVDEIRVIPFNVDRYVLWDQSGMGLNTTGTNVAQGSTKTAVDAATDEIPLCNTTWVLSQPPAGGDPFVVLPDHRQIFHDQELQGLPQNDAGLVQIDGEIIAFRGVGRGQGGGPALLRCERGFMNTMPTPHGYGANVVFLDIVPTTMLAQPLAAGDRDVQANQSRDFAPTGGLVLIDDELLHFSEIIGRTLRMPPRLDERGQETGGLLRGRFGTRPAAHDAESIVLDMPFRHWDRYADGQDNPELAWYGIALNEPGAYVESFAYEEFRPNSDAKLRAFVRTDPDKRWSDPPGDGLLRFEEGVAADKPYRFDRRVERFEVRFMVQYENGCFDPVGLTRHEWKSTPELRSVEVKFRNTSRVLERETER